MSTKPQNEASTEVVPANTVRGAVQQQQAADKPVAVTAARHYAATFAEVLPAHIDAKAFVGAGIGALKRNEDLLAAANNNPDAFLVALMQAATLGHVPGSKEFYLTVRRVRRGNDFVPEVQGLEGYQGVIERMYRSGAVASVKIREVCKDDRFEFVDGAMDRPLHEVDWFSPLDRNNPENILGAYGYAELTTGAVSRVIVLSKVDLERARDKSDAGSDRGRGSSGPWVTDYRAMVLKTVAHRLEPWVPTSAEYRRVMAEAAAVTEKLEEKNLPAPPPNVDPATGEVLEGVSA